MLETILPLLVLTIAALAFGTLGFSATRYAKPEMKWPIRLAVAVALCVAAVDLVSGFKLGMYAVVGPWLFGAGVGVLCRKQAGKAEAGNNDSNQQ